MKNTFLIPVFFLFSFFTATAQQSFVRNKNIILTYVDLTAGTVVADSMVIDAPADGYVLLEFAGGCTASPGDRIVFGINDVPQTGFNNEVVVMEVPNQDQNRINFSQSRLVEVQAGSHEYYALVERFSETDGNGEIHLYATFCATYFPKNVPGEPVALQSGVVKTDISTTSGKKELGKIDFNAPAAGKVMLHFDGMTVSTPGDRFLLATTDDINNGTMPENAASVQAVDEDVNYNTYSHTRTFDVTPGLHTFYGVVAPTATMDGNGNVSVYGNLTLVFYPENGPVSLFSHSVSAPETMLEGPQVLFAEQPIDAPVSGRVLLRFDGIVTSAPGDRIVVAASDFDNWVPNDGATACEAFDENLNTGNFSHIRVYDIEPGQDTYYAVGQNWVELEGTGIASVYGSFTVQFFPSEPIVSTTIDPEFASQFTIAPNPVTDMLLVRCNDELAADELRIEVFDATGKWISGTIKQAGDQVAQVSVNMLPAGVHVLRVVKKDKVSVKNFVKTGS